MSGFRSYELVSDASEEEAREDFPLTERGFVKYGDIYRYLRRQGGSNRYIALTKYNRLVKGILDRIPKGTKPSDKDLESIHSFAIRVTETMSKKYKACKTHRIFRNKHFIWLYSEIKWPKCKSIDLYKIFRKTESEKKIERISPPRPIEYTAKTEPNASQLPNVVPEPTVQTEPKTTQLPPEKPNPEKSESTAKQTENRPFLRNDYPFDCNRDIFLFLQKETGNGEDNLDYKRLERYIISRIEYIIPQADVELIRVFSEKIAMQFHTMYLTCNKDDDKFNEAHNVWLEQDIDWPDCKTTDLYEIFENYRVRPSRGDPPEVLQKKCFRLVKKLNDPALAGDLTFLIDYLVDKPDAITKVRAILS